VLSGDFREAELPLASYDLILLSHVFEHLEEPIGALRRIKELLAADGRAVLFYPNPQSLGARILGKSWFCWEVPRHLVMPPAAALADAAHKGGLILSHARTTARFAAEFFCHSRVLPIRGAPDVRPNIWDKALGLLESLLIILGLDVGDEVIVVLRNGARASDS
jgi:SAM-dependent methyltransferase